MLGRTCFVLELSVFEALTELERAPDEHIPPTKLKLRKPKPTPKTTLFKDNDNFEPSKIEGIHKTLTTKNAKYDNKLPANTHITTKPAKHGSIWGTTDFTMILLTLNIFSLSTISYTMLLH